MIGQNHIEFVLIIGFFNQFINLAAPLLMMAQIQRVPYFLNSDRTIY